MNNSKHQKSSKNNKTSSNIPRGNSRGGTRPQNQPQQRNKELAQGQQRPVQNFNNPLKNVSFKQHSSSSNQGRETNQNSRPIIQQNQTQSVVQHPVKNLTNLRMNPSNNNITNKNNNFNNDMQNRNIKEPETISYNKNNNYNNRILQSNNNEYNPYINNNNNQIQNSRRPPSSSKKTNNNSNNPSSSTSHTVSYNPKYPSHLQNPYPSSSTQKSNPQPPPVAKPKPNPQPQQVSQSKHHPQPQNHSIPHQSQTTHTTHTHHSNYYEQYSPVQFSEVYRAFPAEFFGRDDLELTNSVSLPPSALMKLNENHRISSHNKPIIFRIIDIESNRQTHCGVLDFTADDEFVILPTNMFENLHLKNGEIINLSETEIPTGKFIKIRPHLTEFTKIENPKATLENTLRTYFCVTKGDTIKICVNKRYFDLDIVECRPADAIYILGQEIEVDFDTPIDYVEEDYKEELEKNKKKNKEKNKVKEVPKDEGKILRDEKFVGHYFRLDGGKVNKAVLNRVEKEKIIDNKEENYNPRECKIESKGLCCYHNVEII